MIPGAIPLPGHRDTRLPILPVDVAAKALAQITNHYCNQKHTNKTHSFYKSYHITPDEGLSLNQLYQSTMDHLNIKDKKFYLTDRLPDSLMKLIAEKFAHFQREQLEYILKFPRYSAEDTHKILGSHWCPEFSTYERIFWQGYENYISNQ